MKDRVTNGARGQEIPEPLRNLDVTIVTKLVLEDLLGLNGPSLDDERSILYPSTVDEALSRRSQMPASSCPGNLPISIPRS
jgi:hypothetical protein